VREIRGAFYFTKRVVFAPYIVQNTKGDLQKRGTLGRIVCVDRPGSRDP
jgi:hypothetical protein